MGDELGGAIKPVIITHAGTCASIVADVWVQGWPNNPAIIASDARTAHPEYGVLWGEDKALKATPLQPTTRVGPLLGTVAQWPARIAAWPELRPAKGEGKSKAQDGAA